ncbi:MAG: anhydro-N-acetylmuramic acid kinase [Candidatus Hatepunaea meridiana]|nr:anhydro-N-acetylmuramic acid kinase [Candidatus Hatepunaea meridiana]
MTQNTAKQTRLVAGCMTGTSIDGIDAALVKIEGNGLSLKAVFVQGICEPLGDIAKPLRKLSLQQSMTAGQIAKTAHDFAILHLEVIRKLTGKQSLDLAAIHGQTVFHQPPLSWQLINPAPIAYGLSVPVVYDLRAADLAMGGQGAPITPLADFILFRSETEQRCIVNLGGFCNITILPASAVALASSSADSNNAAGTAALHIEGKDVCSCNQLLDRISGAFFQQSYDENGKHAAQGSIQAEPFEELICLLNEQATNQRSLGTGDELQKWLDEYRDRYTAKDIARTACAAIAETIGRNCKPADRLIIAGGGVRNKTLWKEIVSRAVVPIEMTDSYGVPSQYREAVAIAILGALCQDRIPITFAQVTGVEDPPISGSWVIP